MKSWVNTMYGMMCKKKNGAIIVLIKVNCWQNWSHVCTLWKFSETASSFIT